MARTSTVTIIQSKNKFQNSIIGIILLGLITSAIWYFISPEKNTTAESANLNNNSGNIVVNQEKITNQNNISGDVINGDKIVDSDELDVKKFNKYYFANDLSAITVITDINGLVLAYSITTLDANFTPTIKLNHFESEIILGKSTYDEIDKTLSENYINSPDSINGTLGANWFHYNEEYYLARMGNYQTYIFSTNENGKIGSNFFDNFAEYANREFKDTEIRNDFRKNNSPNTITITSPFFDTEKQFFNYTYGPYQTQIRMLPEKLDNYSPQYLENSFSKLYPESNIKKFEDLFGEPVFIYKEK